MRDKVLICCAAICVMAALMAAPASAAQSAPKTDLSKVTAQKPVRDALVAPGAAMTAASTVAHQSFTDSSGRVFSIDTTVPGYDLSQPAGVLNGTFHGDEITRIKVHVITLSEMRATCGDAQALACYQPESLGNGQLWFAADDSDWIHSLVHEYGHHMDNQIANLSPLHMYDRALSCTIDSDGTRDWFFTRLNTSAMANTFACVGTNWEMLLPELFAEDFVVFNNIHGWQLTTAKEPDATQLDAMRYDFQNRLFTASKKLHKHIRSHHAYSIALSTPNFSFLRVKVVGASGTNFDVYVYPKGSKRYWSRATTKGRIEDYFDVIAPGNWKVVVTSRKKTGRAKISVNVL